MAPTLCSRPLTARAHFEHHPWAREIQRFRLLRTVAATSLLYQRRLLYTRARVLAISLEWSGAGGRGKDGNASGGSGKQRPSKRQAIEFVRSPVKTRSRLRRNQGAEKQGKGKGKGKARERTRGRGRGRGKHRDKEEEEEEEQEGGEESSSFAAEAAAVARAKGRSGDGGVLGCLVVCDINDPRMRHAVEIVHDPR